ncbi:MAG: hypothetical protein ACLUO4_07505 [Christensenellales bacterium]|jgi:uncharacterized integral membrane protein
MRNFNLKRVIPHVSIVCSLILLVLYIINLFNDSMGFLRGSEFELLLVIAIVSAFLTAVFLVRDNWQDEKRGGRNMRR